MSDYITVIHGKDLQRYLASQKHDLAHRIDPAGNNVVSMTMLHNDTDIRAFMLLKLLNDPMPHEAKIEFPVSTYMNISQKVLVVHEDDVPN